MSTGSTDLFGPITRLSGLAFEVEGEGTFAPIYPPNLTTDQIIEIPITDDLPGAIVFNTDTEELETFSAAGFWLPILTAESDINVTDITATTGNFDTINTIDLLASGTINAANGAISGDFGVNGALTAGTIGSIGTLTVDGASTFQGVTIQGDLIVNGNSILDNMSALTVDINDFEANTAKIDSLLYGQSSITGVSPITASLDVAAGTGATYTMTGSNLGGVFRLNTGTGPAGAGNIIATFTIPSGLLPYLSAKWSIIFMPGSATTALYETTSNIYVTTAEGSNQFIMGTSAQPLVASTSYYWNYILVGNILGT